MAGAIWCAVYDQARNALCARLGAHVQNVIFAQSLVLKYNI